MSGRGPMTATAPGSRAVFAVLCLLGAIMARAQDEPPQLLVEYPRNVQVFDLCELQVHLPEPLAAFEDVPVTELHDVYDANRNGIFLQLRAEFEHEDGEKMAVMGFAMRERPNGPWRWRIRWSPTRRGRWQGTVHFLGCPRPDGEIVLASTRLPEPIEAWPVEGLAGHLLPPGPDHNARYLRQRLPDGDSRALWLFGACRAWIAGHRGQEGDSWHAHEWIDARTELLAPMRAGGYNLLNQWMAPWEYLLVHHDPAEYWRQEDDSWRRYGRPAREDWSSYQCYDQGRARAFDRYLRLCEGDTQNPTVRLLLAPLPHQCLQTAKHPWGAPDSGWTTDPDQEGLARQKLNGFSGFQEEMGVWDFFAADPAHPLDDWRSQLWDHQANFFTYVFARWGYSRAVGIWVLVGELDGVGDNIGYLARDKGWWGHPECGTWLANMVRFCRGELLRSDGLPYSGDPYRRPVHAGSTSYGGPAGQGGNLLWNGGPEDARIDLFGWHWFPWWRQDTPWPKLWDSAVAAIIAYGQLDKPGTAPRLVTEFGLPDRLQPGDPLADAYPSLYHFAIWSSLLSGQAGTVMDWDDGKEFGELRYRERPGPFSQENYPLDHRLHLAALRAFLGDLDPAQLWPCQAANARITCEPVGTVRAAALYSARPTDRIHGWAYAPAEDSLLRFGGLAVGVYSVTWYDPWSGAEIPDLEPQLLRVMGDGRLELDLGPALRILAAAAEAFPAGSRWARGRDVAFKIVGAAE